MSLEHAQEIMKTYRHARQYHPSKDVRLTALLAELLVDLIEEVRWLRTDLDRLDQDSTETLKE